MTILLSEEQIQTICKDIAHKISIKLKDDPQVPVVIGVMKGGLNFTLDLIKYFEIPIATDYIQISSYDGTCSTGIINLKKDITLNIKGRTIILADDVVDTGYSMHYLKHYLSEKYQPKEILIATLVDKKSIRKVDVTIDYCGMTLNENKFLLGYGLDYKELEREVPYIYIPDKEDLDRLDNLIKVNTLK